tara:strand:+ start:253 stop:627 length:375 start_codon:yes stop_codon:yes gene_type:complete
MNILFVCTSNIKRSRTAEDLFSKCPSLKVESAGTRANTDNTQLSQELIDWADKVFVMSEKDEGHLTYIEDNFSQGNTKVYDLDIHDMYAYQDRKLKLLLIERVSKYIDLKSCLDYLLSEIKESQ